MHDASPAQCIPCFIHFTLTSRDQRPTWDEETVRFKKPVDGVGHPKSETFHGLDLFFARPRGRDSLRTLDLNMHPMHSG
jgi:hypothetical protein